ncbi:L-xylulose reductase-like [Paramacrobiotus metropolitanus]|uniref:L-xylulose reductase-like n=1 Tax=Paramacrobiotus metropolitanus TaxID=2943436 RepID=UPI0024465262|nr:L-xylulose reductase-like [Paramacrobiotus metropolitanus]
MLEHSFVETIMAVDTDFFKGKRVLVTGAGRGIGKGIAIRLAGLGAEVFAISVSSENLQTLKQECPNIRPVPVDLNGWAATERAVESILPIDMLVNNAGVFIPESFIDSTEETYERILGVNLKAVFNVSRIVAKSMVERKYAGSIVNLSSVAGQIAIPNHAAYCASKGALDALTRSMALELGPHNIRVNGLSPTVILTDMGRQGWSDPEKAGPLLARIPVHKFGEVDDCVDAVLFLLSNQSKFITGISLPLDGGLLAT